MRLGRAVEEARDSKGLTQMGLGQLADGAGRTVIQTIERGHKFKKVTKTLLNVEHALGWKRGSVESILAGGEPLPSDEFGELDSNGQLGKEAYRGLPLRVAHAILEGVTLDTAIVPLTENTSMVIVLKSKSNATHEEMKSAMQLWEEGEGSRSRLPALFDEPRGTQEP